MQPSLPWGSPSWPGAGGDAPGCTAVVLCLRVGTGSSLMTAPWQSGSCCHLYVCGTAADSSSCGPGWGGAPLITRSCRQLGGQFLFSCRFQPAPYVGMWGTHSWHLPECHLSHWGSDSRCGCALGEPAFPRACFSRRGLYEAGHQETLFSQMGPGDRVRSAGPWGCLPRWLSTLPGPSRTDGV